MSLMSTCFSDKAFFWEKAELPAYKLLSSNARSLTEGTNILHCMYDMEVKSGGMECCDVLNTLVAKMGELPTAFINQSASSSLAFYLGDPTFKSYPGERLS